MTNLPATKASSASDDPAFVKSEAPAPVTMSGFSSVGFPSFVVPMVFGSQGLPMTITFFGKPHEGKKFIGFAYTCEQATKLRKRSTLAPPFKGEITTRRNEIRALGQPRVQTG